MAKKKNPGRRNKSNDKPKTMVKNNEGIKKKTYTKTQSEPSSSTIDEDIPLPKETSVEITSDDDQGSHIRWYVGTILNIVPAEKGQTKTTEKKVRCYRVQFTTAEGNTFIHESVPAVNIRPLPPRDDNDDLEFEVKDVVDVFYKHGWLVGTVVNVVDGVDNKKKYNVMVKYLDDEVLEFETSKMRVHLDWVDSCWKFPPKKLPKDKEKLADKSSTHTPRVVDAPYSASTAESNSEMIDFVDSSVAPTAGFTTPAKRPPTNETCESGDDGDNQQGSQPVLRYKRKKRVSKGISLPFKKVSPRWTIYESNDYYQKSSQKPHFSPLKEDPPERVERMALAQMVRFIEVVKRLKIFKSTDPADIILKDLKIVDDLQSHGFNVSVIKARLLQLEKWKVEIGQFEEEVEKIHKDIVMHEIQEPVIEAEIKELKEKLDESERAKTKKDTEITMLRSDLYLVTYEILEEEIACNELDEREVVKELSQMPHFSPLKEFEEADHEESATFDMDMFIDLVGRKFKSSDPMDILVDALEEVVEFERRGFHVSAMKAHLNDLQKCKAKMSELQERKEKIKKDLDKLCMEMLVVDGEVEQFQMKVDESERAKKKKDTEFKKLKSRWYLVRHQILKVKIDIDKLVASPL